MNIDKRETAIVFIDPQNEVLSDKGRAWRAVGASVTENKTIETMERLFKAGKDEGFEVFSSPHFSHFSRTRCCRPTKSSVSCDSAAFWKSP